MSITSSPHKIACFLFWQEVDKYCSTSGVIIVKIDFSNFFALATPNSCTVLPNPLGYCSVTIIGICSKLAASICKFFSHKYLRYADNFLSLPISLSLLPWSQNEGNGVEIFLGHRTQTKCSFAALYPFLALQSYCSYC